MSLTPDRVRFAPSPTGYLHIGGVRAALYNWLWARKTKGQFILRIEDTDRERSTEASVKVILESMKWCGLNWDEGPEVGGPNGPYYQTQRLELYREFADKLIAKGHAFRCYCTKEDLELAREEQRKAGKQFFKYPGTCRNRQDHPDKPYVVRLKAPTSGSTGWNDLVRGRIDVPNESQQDVVLVRPDGVPLYNFGAVIDDITMGITLVARGDDHMVNTPIQILLYEALATTTPKFAHLPMILGPDGQKLSKRHAAVAVTEYRDEGYLEDAVLNYLARLGWSYGDQEIFTRGEMIDKFDWSSVGKTGARYDAKKFSFVQASHLRMLNDEDIAIRAFSFLSDDIADDVDREELVRAVATVRTRATTLKEVAEQVDFYFREIPVEDPKAAAKFLTKESAALLVTLRDLVAVEDEFNKEALEKAVHDYLQQHNIPLKNMAQPARVALTGQSQSPGLYEVMEVLGQDRTLSRLTRAIDRIASNKIPAAPAAG